MLTDEDLTTALYSEDPDTLLTLIRADRAAVRAAARRELLLEMADTQHVHAWDAAFQYRRYLETDPEDRDLTEGHAYRTAYWEARYAESDLRRRAEEETP